MNARTKPKLQAGLGPRGTMMAIWIIGAAGTLAGCGAAMVAGDIVRGRQKDLELVPAPGVTPEQLQGAKRVGISINAVDPNTQQVVWPGTGSTNRGVFSDMLVREFLKLGYDAHPIGETLTEPISQVKLDSLSSGAVDMILIGQMNVGASTGYGAVFTGGDWWSTGVRGATVKGINPDDGKLLFVMSAEYGKVKKAGEVCADLANTYQDYLRSSPQGR